MARSSKDLLQRAREALDRHSPAPEQVMEPGNGRDAGVFINPIRSC